MNNELFFCGTLFFCQKSAKSKFNSSIYELFLRLIYFKCMIFRVNTHYQFIENRRNSWFFATDNFKMCIFFLLCKYAVISSNIGKIWDFCKYLPVYELLLQFIFFKFTIILHKYTISLKICKINDTQWLGFEFSDWTAFSSW